jgi:hypothetical protein
MDRRLSPMGMWEIAVVEKIGCLFSADSGDSNKPQSIEIVATREQGKLNRPLRSVSSTYSQIPCVRTGAAVDANTDPEPIRRRLGVDKSPGRRSRTRQRRRYRACRRGRLRTAHSQRTWGIGSIWCSAARPCAWCCAVATTPRNRKTSSERNGSLANWRIDDGQGQVI